MSDTPHAPLVGAVARWLADETGLIVAPDPRSLADTTDEDLARYVPVWSDLSNPIDPEDLKVLARAQRVCPFLVVSANDAERRPGPGWSPAALASALDAPFLGHTVDAVGDPTRLVVIAGTHAARPAPRPGFRVAAVMHVRNEVDILPEVIEHLASEGVEVHVFDNWSTDGTWDVLVDAERRGLLALLQRHPADGPDDHSDWESQLRLTEAHAATLDVDWVITNDADEIRSSPWPGVRMVDALGRIDALGYNAAAFTVVDFRFVDADPEPVPPFRASMDHFEFGRRPGHFLQIKAWKNSERVDLATNAGHAANFAGRQTFPLKLLLRHYPLRGVTHARRKVFEDRLPRWEAERSTHGWHVHYDKYADLGDVPSWAADSLERWDERSFLDEHVIERLTGVGLAEGTDPGGAPVTSIGAGVSYRDGAEEALLATLQAATDVSSGSDELLGEIVDWPTRYHLSPQRANLLKPINLRPGLRVLDVGAGTGALARYLGEQGCDVTALEGNEVRARVAAERCRGLDNVEIVSGTIDDLDPAATYDVVLIIGVLEYSTAEIGGAGGPERLLESARAHLAAGGALVLAIENQLGLKYLMGGAEDHRGRPWVGIEDYAGPPGPRTWTRRELAALIADAGLPHQTWLAPYPDYKLPSTILHERAFALDGAERLISQIVLRPVSFHDQAPARTGDAAAAHATFLRGGLGLDVASSFLVVASADPAGDRWVRDDVIAWLPAGNRRAAFRRDRVLTSDRQLEVVTSTEPVTEGWLRHDAGSTWTFVDGVTLGDQLDAALRAHDLGQAEAVLRRWSAHLRAIARPVPSGAPLVGPYGPRPGQLALPPELLDASPTNFVDVDGEIVLIDDEWRVLAGVDLELATLRALWTTAHSIVTSGIAHPWALEATVGEVFGQLADMIGLDATPEARARLTDAEAEFQHLVTGADEVQLRGDWLLAGRRGLDNRPDEQMRVDLDFRTRQRDDLEERLAVVEDQRTEMEGQRDHYIGVADAHAQELARTRSLHGWAIRRMAGTRIGQRLRRRG